MEQYKYTYLQGILGSRDTIIVGAISGKQIKKEVVIRDAQCSQMNDPAYFPKLQVKLLWTM